MSFSIVRREVLDAPNGKHLVAILDNSRDELTKPYKSYIFDSSIAANAFVMGYAEFCYVSTKSVESPIKYANLHAEPIYMNM